ncbi:unnamed protein product [Paramecium primaurelia]|uniref:Uncharacterized protein n=2 Tax=Paramecium TaxID=5884 RepID=A0A8S1VRU8_9CILI|nr:unnamed protein product [Paramecium primaurelia]CAD8178973.1 unnamed protein product [Paramecium pentaurelia]
MINNLQPLFGMYKELWIENATQLKDALEKWDQHQLKSWLQKMERTIFTFQYDECIGLLDEFQPNYIQNLPNDMGIQCNKLRTMFQNNSTQYLIVNTYLKLLRCLKKSLEPIYNSTHLLNSIRNLELYLSSPLNQNTIKPQECNCTIF